mmetsp:Transcript_24846/g.42058  ORF Transcript_24846/g.42058 Transcript_24846/m.42058 type:complete len:415 (-) Transcript_24846:93-1337(-)
MFTSAPSVFSVNYQARAICTQKARSDKHRFLVGTCSTKEVNELSVLEFDEDSNQLDAAGVYRHPNQIWAIEPSPSQSELVITSSQSTLTGGKELMLYRMPREARNHSDDTENNIDNDVISDPDRESQDINYSSGDLLDLETVSSFNYDDPSTFVHSVKWHPVNNQVLALDPCNLTSWAVTESDVKSVSSFSLTDESDVKNPPSVSSWQAGAVAWDPHRSQSCAVVSGKSELRIIDTRKMQAATVVKGIHRGRTRDVDFNSNKPQALLTAGDDRKIKLWDARNFSTPVKTLEGHSHWVWSAKYNPFHDQLVVSGGGDNVVNLWRIASCSSAPWLGADMGCIEDDEDLEGLEQLDISRTTDADPPDVKIKSVDQHEDCVYSLAWSPAEAWMYCSLSYEGRVVLNHVPSTEKYKILL